MKKIVLLFILFLRFISVILGQEVLDTAYLKCQYKLLYSHDTTQTKQEDDLLILQIGRKISKSYSYYTFQADSLHETPDGRAVWRSLFKKAIREAHGGIPTGFPHRRASWFIYKNYPEGEMTVTDAISLERYIYRDSMNCMHWQIGEDAKEILGYSCQKVECDFRGRHYTAWFTPDIPVSDGPWKFSGLPGLIMEVSDRGNQYHFTITGIEKVAEPIVFSPSTSQGGKFIKTSRKKFLKAKKRAIMNMNGYIKAETGIDLNLGDGHKVMRYDFLERDYNQK